MLSYLKIAFTYLSSFVNKIRIISHGGKVGSKFYCDGWISIYGKGKINIGDNVSINSRFGSNPLTSSCRSVFWTHTDATISIGDNVGISNACIAAREQVRIGNNVLIGVGTCIYDNDFHSIRFAERQNKGSTGALKSPVIINDGVFVGASSIILKGVNIGEMSVIGAGSVVAKSIPNNQVWAGNPAKLIKLADFN